jgi:fermentation-respiration switch protein FrsA (DUF1100 family)
MNNTSPSGDFPRTLRPVLWVLTAVVLLPLSGCGPTAETRPALEARVATSSQPADPPGPVAAPNPSAGPSLDELLLFFPSKYPEGNWKPAGLAFEDVWFSAADGTRLHGWYCPCARARAVLLYAHGNAGNLALYGPLMRYFQNELRVTTLVFDYRGYGCSEGVPTVEGVVQDARAARAFLARRAGVEESAVVLMGRSLGGAVVVQLAAEAPARGLVLESTFASLRAIAAHHYPRLAWLVPADKLDSTARIARHRGPLLQSHGDADRTIPYAQGLKLFEAAQEPKTFVRVPGGDHNDPQPAEFFRRLDQFVSELP